VPKMLKGFFHVSKARVSKSLTRDILVRVGNPSSTSLELEPKNAVASSVNACACCSANDWARLYIDGDARLQLQLAVLHRRRTLYCFASGVV
jgi:hypothetical protein